MAAHKKRNINLLPYGTFDSSVKGRVLNWSLSTFRTIVVIVEVIVIAGFLARFWIDAQNSSLDEKIMQKMALIDSYSDFEKTFKNYQGKLAIISENTQDSKSMSTNMKAISDEITPEVILTNIFFSPQSTILQGQTISERDVERLLLKLQQHSNFNGLFLSSLESDKFSPYLNFQMSIQAREEEIN